ncbi:MAG: class I SAM-dependent methyltransferase [Lachnospiraceae bacterium]|nr:class I SAM-dependent methyltransferase [Lachnospiraceae bacterium]
MSGKTTGSVRLSERMLAIAQMVSPGMRVCDVGCDHGFVSIYLVEEGIAPSVLAMDIGKGPLGQAQIHIEEAGLQDRITTRLSDGLKQYREGEADCLIIAGMGGPLMQEILSNKKVEDFKEIILAPQSEICEFRKFLADHGFEIVAENMVFEDGKYYPMMKVHLVVRGEEGRKVFSIPGTRDEEVAYRFGPLLLSQKNPVLRQYLHKEEHKNIEILNSLKDYGGERIGARRNILEQELFFIRMALQEMEGEG